jgi:hypothetical protein
MIGIGMAMRLNATKQTPTQRAINILTSSGPGAWYDPSDLATLFQDSAGTTPVTAVEQPVGLVLDKSKGLVLGAELVANGDFANGNTGWVRSLTSWDASTGSMVNDGTNAVGTQCQQNGVITAGKTYRIEFDLTRTSGTLNVWLNGSQLVQFGIATSGRKTFTIAATVSGNFMVEASIGAVLAVDNVTVRELPGNHLIQPTATSRPTLKQDENGLYHLHFDGVDDSLYSAASIDFTSTDKMTVFAGLHKASDTGVGTVVELSADASVNDGAFSYWNNGAAPGADAAAFRGSVVVSPTAALPAPDTKVVSLVGDIAADTALIRHNGVQVGSSVADQGTGNFGNYPLYIGRRNNASLPFNGRLYPLAIKGKALSAGEITTVEAFVKTKTGAYDPTLQALLTEAGNELATESDLYIEME